MRQSGFTLLEIAVVLFIMGLVLTIVIPYLGGVKRAELKSAARRLAGRANYLFNEASTRKLVIRLIFDVNHNSYRVMVADPYALRPMFIPDPSPAGAPVTLPASVRIHDVTVEGVGTCTRGAIACQFYPGGYVDATVIHLVDTAGDVMTLGFDPLTGQVLIARGDLTQAQMALQ